MISCEKAAIICNKTQYKESSFWEKLSLRFHLAMCKTCSKFTKQNTEFTNICDKANLHIFTEDEKAAMKQQLEQK